MSLLVDLHTVRRNRQWVVDARRRVVFENAVLNAEKDEAPTALFHFAYESGRMLAEGIGKRSAHLWCLRGAAGMAEIPSDEAEEIIKAGLRCGRQRSERVEEPDDHVVPKTG